ncbi:MAG: tetratricopeptide repeat protein [Acidobacteriota bacterium]
MARSPIAMLAVLILNTVTSLPVLEGSQSERQKAEELLKAGRVEEALPLLLNQHRLQPADAALSYQIGLAYTRLEQLDSAAEFYRKALHVNPRLIPARRNLATVLWFQGQKTESEKQFHAVSKVQPEDPIAHFYLGVAAFERKEFATARDRFLKGGDLAFRNPESLPMVLETFLAAKDLEAVNRLLQIAGTEADLSVESRFRVGLLFGRYGHFDRAVQSLFQIRETYPDRKVLLRNLGLAQLESGEFQDAIATFQSGVELGDDSMDVQLWLAEAYEKSGNPEGAYQALSKAVDRSPSNEVGYLALAQFASAHHNNEFAVQILERGLKKIPGSSKLLVEKGVLHALDQDFQSAQISFEQAAQSEPTSTLPLLSLGLVKLQSGKLDQAVAMFKEAGSRDSGDYRPRYLLALSLIRMGGQDEPVQRKAILDALREALKCKPDHVESLVSLGQTLMADGQTDSALAQLKKAVALDPEHATALYQLGLAYRKLGKLQEAQQSLTAFENLKVKSKQEEDEARRELVQILKLVSGRSRN